MPLSSSIVENTLNLPKIIVNTSVFEESFFKKEKKEPIFKKRKELPLILQEAISLQKKGLSPSFIFEDKEHQTISNKIEKIESKYKKTIKDREKLLSLNEELEEKKKAHDTLHSCLDILIDFNANSSLYKLDIQKQFEGLLNVLNGSYWDGDKTIYDTIYKDFIFTIYLTNDDLKKLMKKASSIIEFNTLDEFIEDSTICLGLQVIDLGYDILVSNVIPKFIYELSNHKLYSKKSIEDIRAFYNISDYSIGLH